MKKYTLKGINNDVETCAQCGKTNLKRVAWVAPVDADGGEGEPMPVGVDCAGTLLGWDHNRARRAGAHLLENEKLYAKVLGFAERGTERAKIVDWCRRLHPGLFPNATVDHLVLTSAVEGTKVTYKVW